MSDKPLYFVKSQAGVILGPVTADELIVWLNNKRVSNDADVRREGLQILEKDELWGKLKDFAIFGYAGPYGREEVKMLKSRARTLWTCGIIFLSINALVFVSLFFLPMHDAEVKLGEAASLFEKAKGESRNFEARLDKDLSMAKKAWAAELDQNIKKWEADRKRLEAMLLEQKDNREKAEKLLKITQVNNDEMKAGKLESELRIKSLNTNTDRVEEHRRNAEEKFSVLQKNFDQLLASKEAELRSNYEEARQRLEANGTVDRNMLMRPLVNPNMARIVSIRGESIYILMRERPAAHAKLELFDGERTLTVEVQDKAYTDAMVWVKLIPGPQGEVSAFFDKEVLVRRRP